MTDQRARYCTLMQRKQVQLISSRLFPLPSTTRRAACPLGDPQPDTRTVGRAATATCEGAVSYDLSGERLTERGLSGRPHPAPGPRTRRASAGQRYIRWFFRQYYRFLRGRPTHSWGLGLVARLAARWGWRRRGGRTVTWFELRYLGSPVRFWEDPPWTCGGPYLTPKDAGLASWGRWWMKRSSFPVSPATAAAGCVVDLWRKRAAAAGRGQVHCPAGPAVRMPRARSLSRASPPRSTSRTTAGLR